MGRPKKNPFVLHGVQVRLTGDDIEMIDSVIKDAQKYLVVREYGKNGNLHVHIWLLSNRDRNAVANGVVAKLDLPASQKSTTQWGMELKDLAYFMKGNKVMRGGGYDCDMKYDIIKTTLSPPEIDAVVEFEREYLAARQPTSHEPHQPKKTLEQEFRDFYEKFDVDESELIAAQGADPRKIRICEAAGRFVAQRRTAPQRHMMDNIVWKMITETDSKSYTDYLMQKYVLID